MADWKVGDPVVLTGANTRGKTYAGSVTHVGRTLVTIDAPGSGMSGYKFRMDTGFWNDKNFSYHWRVYSPEEFADKQRRDLLVQTLARTHQVEVFRARLSLSALEAILEIVEGDK